MFKHLVILMLIVACGQTHPMNQEAAAAATCQKACQAVDPDKINVHLVPHSHDDVGWLKTMDQYYYGSHSEIQRAGVEYIISSTVEALKADPNRRFVQVETAFFWKWWQNQPETIRQDFIDLVNSGQIEIINAAWSMNDEAATNYQSTIDQFTHGLRTINDTIGECGIPRIGWQIDPFGHSREQASIFSQLGYDAVFFARIDFIDRFQRMLDKNLEVIWKGSANSDNSYIFTSAFPEFYSAPNGFCFDINCGDDVLVDDETSPDYNIPLKAGVFEVIALFYASYFRTKNILIPMGGDFQYQSAERNFINLDKLIRAFQGNNLLNLIYSTPSCYIQAVNDDALINNINFTVKIDDYFPYASDAHCYWTGYFTSRPNAKRFERTSNNILQAAKQLTSFSKIKGVDYENDLTSLKQALGVLQHHDAITGTAKEAVARDYSRLLTKGINTVEPALNAITTDLLKKNSSTTLNLSLQTCLLANVSVCEASKSDRFVVTVYNPLERPVTHYVRLPVPDGTYTITGAEGEVVSDLLDSISSFTYLDSSVGLPSSKELVFPANLPGLSLRLYYVERTATKSSVVKESPNLRFGSATTSFEIDEGTGLLSSVTLNGQTLAIKQEFLYYEGFNGDNDGFENRASGAYIFRPLINEAKPFGASVSVTSTSGVLVDEVRQQIAPWVTQIIRVYKATDENYIEFDWLVGPIEVDVDSGIGKEIVTRFTISNFDNAESFFTDSNGRELIKRQLNKRYDYEYDATMEPIASNYYPITSRIVIKDENQSLEVAVLNDRAQGGSSLSNGTIELMVHRRLLRDDSEGVGEALDDEEFRQGVVARGQHYLVLGSSNYSIVDGRSIAAQERELALKKLLTPLVLVAPTDSTLEEVQSSLNFNFDALKSLLPDNVHILTLEPWKEDSFILRLEHILENNEDDNLSQPASVDLAGLFTFFEITDIRETTLGANQWLDEFEAKEKYVWHASDGKSITNKKITPVVIPRDPIVSLNPMEIRTFIIKVDRNFNK